MTGKTRLLRLVLRRHGCACRRGTGNHCSTDEQTTENQIRELRHVARRHGWDVVAVFDDNGISGGVPREDRPAMETLLRAVARAVRSTWWPFEP
jgi:hypothetical protein